MLDNFRILLIKDIILSISIQSLLTDCYRENMIAGILFVTNFIVSLKSEIISTVFKMMMENCFRNVQNIRKNVFDIIISPIYHKIKAEKQLQSDSEIYGRKETTVTQKIFEEIH